MPIDFSFSQEVEDARLMMRGFLQDTVKPAFAALRLVGAGQVPTSKSQGPGLLVAAYAPGCWGNGVGCDGIGCGFG